MNKEAIKDEIIDQQNEIIADLKQSRSRYDEVADMDENATHDPEDFSHQNQSHELKRRIEGQIRIAENELRYVEKLPILNDAKVGPGALIVTSGPAFYISIAAQPFHMEGKQIICFSMDAPIAGTMEEKKVGDKVKLGKAEYTVEQIL